MRVLRYPKAINWYRASDALLKFLPKMHYTMAARSFRVPSLTYRVQHTRSLEKDAAAASHEENN
jgi:hypothetical protein